MFEFDRKDAENLSTRFHDVQNEPVYGEKCDDVSGKQLHRDDFSVASGHVASQLVTFLLEPGTFDSAFVKTASVVDGQKPVVIFCEKHLNDSLSRLSAFFDQMI